MKKKTILFIEFCPINGSATGLLSQLEYMSKNYDDQFNRIVISSPSSIFEKVQRKYNFKLYSFKVPEVGEFDSHFWKTLKLWTKANFEVLKIALKHKVDIIHCYHYMWSSYATPTSFIIQKPLFIHLKDVWMLEPKIARILMKIYPKTTYIAVSNYVKKLFTQKYKTPKDSTVMVYDGVNKNIFYGLSDQEIDKKIKAKKKTIIMSSRIAKERDIEIFIDMAAMLTKEYPDLRFEHYGYSKHGTDQKYMNSLKMHVKQLGLQKKFSFVPYIRDQKEMAKKMRQAFISIVPAKQFALPNVAIESIFSSTPVIAGDLGGNPEIIQNNNGGLLVPVQSALQYAQAVKKIIDSKNKYKEITKKGQQSAIKKFNVDNIFEKIISMYQK
jgi:glycosyltransferase involved in cell wall biosynthesis